ncbi:MAG: trypsin-like peptidase domain-containing protein [bacterium]|nr:trypsin-like peptidase domain-containing protein [bacterium]
MSPRVPVDTQPPRPIGLKFFAAAVALSFIAGIGGAAAGTYLLKTNPDTPTNGTAQQVTVTEESAVIDAVQEVAPAVVSIDVTGAPSLLAPGGTEGAGSGFVITADGLIVTNRHVVEDLAERPTVILEDGRDFEAEVVGTDPVFDLALLKIGAVDLPVVELGEVDSLQVGQQVIAIGNALGQFDHTVTTGVLSATGRAVIGDAAANLDNLLQTDAAINPGNSGGPLVNLEGQVIGINTAIAGGAEGIGFAIPVDVVRQAIDSYQERGEIVRAQLGVTSVTLTPEVAEERETGVSQGALIISVVPNSAAAEAGIRPNDVITAVGDTAVDREHSLSSLIAAHSPGDRIQVTIRRGGEERALSVTLGRRVR